MLEDWPGLLDSFNGAGSTVWAANAFTAPHALLLLLGRHQATTKRAHWKFALMFFTELCAPLIYQVFFDKWLAAVGTARRYPLAKTIGVIGCSFMQVEFGIAYRFVAGCAEEVLGVPGGSQGFNIVSPDGLFTLFTGCQR